MKKDTFDFSWVLDTVYGKQNEISDQEDPYLPDTGVTRKYRYVFITDGHLDSEGEDVIECKDCIFGIKPMDMNKIKEHYSYDPEKDLIIESSEDLKGVKDIIVTG